MYTDAGPVRLIQVLHCQLITLQRRSRPSQLSQSSFTETVREREDLGTKFQHVSTFILSYPISPGLAYLFLFVCHLLMYVLVCFLFDSKFWEPNQLIEETNNGHQLQLLQLFWCEIFWTHICMFFFCFLSVSCIYHKHCPGREPLGWHMSSAMTWGRARL